MLVNLTPHPIRIYPARTPDRIQVDSGEWNPVLVLEPAEKPARLAEDTLGTWFTLDEVAVEGVDYGSVYGLPQPDHEATDVNLPPRTYYVVSLVVALAARGRSDLLVPYREVRNLEGAVVGCRQLAQPC